MNTEYTSGYLSIIGVNFLQPIGVLLNELFSLEPRDPNEVQSSPLENGYSISLIMLTILMVESFIRRIQFICEKEEIRCPLEFIRQVFPDYEKIDEVEELFVMRDVIAHNHVWGCQILWDTNGKMKFKSIDKRLGGDKKFNRVIDMKNRKTRCLDLNLFPTRINREDVSFVLNEALDLLLYIEEMNRNFVYISPEFLMIKRNPVLFVDYVRGLKPSETLRLYNQSLKLTPHIGQNSNDEALRRSLAQSR